MDDRPFLDLKAAGARLRARVLAVNAEHAAQTSPLDRSRLADLIAAAEIALARADGRAFVLALGEGAAYSSPNFQWFRARYPEFLYVDRIVVGAELQGRGTGRALYARVFEAAARRGVPVAAEVNTVPPNPVSDSFHARLGFAPVGEARLGSRKAVRYYLRG